jgi:hypothetical protein
MTFSINLSFIELTGSNVPNRLLTVEKYNSSRKKGKSERLYLRRDRLRHAYLPVSKAYCDLSPLAF